MEKLLRLWFETSSAGLALLDYAVDGEADVEVLHCQYVNARFAHLLEQLPEDLIGHPISRCFPSIPEQEFVRQAQIVHQTGETCQWDYYNPDKDRWFAISLSQLADYIAVSLQDISEQKKVERQQQQQLARETLIAGLSIRLARLPASELDSYIQDALAQVGAHMDAWQTVLFLYPGSDQHSRQTYTYHWCSPTPAYPRQADLLIPVTNFAWTQQCMMAGQLIRLNTDALPPEATEEHNAFAMAQVRAMILVPLAEEGKVIGFMGLYTRHDIPRVDQETIFLLENVAALLACALGRQQQEWVIRQTTRQLDGLNQLCNAMFTSSIDSEKLEDMALQYLYGLIPCELAVVLRIDSAGERAYTNSRYRHGKREEWGDVQIPLKYIHPSLLDQGKELLINRLEADTIGFSADLHPYKWGYRSLLGLPLVEQPPGYLILLLDRTPDFFSQEHVWAGRQVAGLIALISALENSSQPTNKQTKTQNEVDPLLLAVVNTSPVGLALLRPVYKDSQIVDFTYLLTNPVNSLITGISQEEMMAKSLVTIFPFVRTNGMFNRLAAVAETGQPQKFQLWADLEPGELWGDYTISQVGTDVLLTINNITPIKQIEAELRKTNLDLEERVAERTAQIQQLSAMQRAILQYAGLAITATDVNGLIQLVNPALEELTGYQADELVGKRNAGELREPSFHQKQIDLLKPDVNDLSLVGEDVVAAYVDKHKFLRRENMMLTKEGKQIPVLSTVSGLYNEDHTLTGFVDIITDISYLKTIEQELVQARYRGQIATKAGKLGIWEWNLQTDELELEEDFYAYFDLPNNTRIRHVDDLKSLIHPADLLYFNQYIDEIKTGRKTFDVEFRVILPITKVLLYIKADGLFLENEDGGRNRMIGVIRDRTAKRLAEHALRTSEQRYRSLVDQLKEVLFQTNERGLWIYLNPAWERITGFTVEESLGGFFLDSILQDDWKETQELFEAIRARQQTHINHVIRYIHKDGGYRWIDVVAEINLDQDNQFAGVTGTLTDITARKEAEEAIKESEQRFREIADNVDELFWIRDINEPRFLYVNKTFERYTGKSVEQLYADPFAFLTFVLEEDRPTLLDAFLSREPGTGFKFRTRHQSGSIHWLEARIFIVKNEEGALTRRIGVATDITTAIEKEQILEESLNRERMLNTLKSQFISTASHEFRTPLTAISSSIDLVKHYLQMDSGSPFVPLISKHADTISQKVISLNDLITDTLTISKIEEGMVAVQLEPTDLVALSEELVSYSFHDREDRRQVEILVTGQVVEVNLDKKLMNHVLTNLLTNAFKFSTKNPILKITFCGKAAAVSISDKGIGIPPEELGNLFSKFFRASNAVGFQGTGLGLAICQEYVHLQHGHIKVNSTEGVGTTVTVVLPLPTTSV
ncbi:PAS domain S-box protein [Spirosoma aerophilum]